MDTALLIEKLNNTHSLNKDEALQLIKQGAQHKNLLFALAQKTAQKSFGRQIFVRGLIEFTNYCKNDKNPALRFMTPKPGFFFCAQTCLLKQAVCYLIRFSYTSTVILSKCQISSTYSWIVRSDENLPACAIFKIALFAQPSSSLYASMTRFCASA